MITVMRGVSGAGKSTYIREHLPEAMICSADHFFTDKNGIYIFDRAKLGEAHGVCLRTYVELLMADEPNIIVDNTNLSVYEVAPYMALASAYGRDVKIITLKTSVDLAIKRNIHGVPAQTIKSMAWRMIEQEALFPKFWKHEVIRETPCVLP